ncbi:MAG: asparagine synthase (glutamine-hydrolyzing) [Terriglobales bacterium]
MCGICGMVGAPAKTPEAAQAQVGRMAARLRHRGPDEEGYYGGAGIALGSRRLRILDLEHGQQPLRNERGDVVAVFNGEIYNYAELRRELLARGHQFRSQGDGEVIVHLYEEHGESLPRFLEGMFALAIWDAPRRALILARDRFGVKPLYYAARTAGLSFASELAALREDPGWDHGWDHTALDLYLELNYIPAPYSAYLGARKLPAGHVLRWQEGQLRLFRYWSLPERLAARAEAAGGAPEPPPEAELAEELQALLGASVRRRLVSDVPLGLFLSGGLDSASVLALMSEALPRPVRTFSVGFAEKSFSELPAARRLARRFGADHQELILRPEAVAELPAIAAQFDEPFGDSSALPVYLVAQLARRSVTVCLGGDGGDELLAGYPTYAALALSRWHDRLPPRLRAHAAGTWMELLPPSRGKLPWSYRLAKFRQGITLPPAQRVVGWRAIFTREERRRLWRRAVWPGTSSALLAEIAAEWETGDWLNQALYTDLRLYLCDDILVKLDRMTMAHSLEGREPWLDTELVLFAFSLPGRLKLRRWRGKHLLRRAMRGRLPAATLRAGKQGFSIPLGAWLRGPLRRVAEETLRGGALEELLDRDLIAMMLRRHASGEADYGRQLWNLMVLAQWLAAAVPTGRTGPVGATRSAA